MLVQEARHVAGLRPVERVGPGSVLHVMGLPHRRPRAVHVVPAHAVFIEPAVPVVVDSLATEHRPVARRLRAVACDADHDPRIGRVESVRALAGGVLAHRENAAVSIEIVRRILVEQPVAIAVHRIHARSRRSAAANPLDAPVGIHRGHEVERRAVEEIRDSLVGRVVLAEVPREVDDDLGSLHLVAVDVPVHPHRRLLVGATGGPVRDRIDAQLAVLDRLPDHFVGDELRPLRLEPIEVGEDLVVVVEAVPRDLHLRRAAGRESGKAFDVLRERGRDERENQAREDHRVTSAIRRARPALSVSTVSSRSASPGARTSHV